MIKTTPELIAWADRAGMRTQEIADVCDVGTNTVYRWRHGQRKMDLEPAMALLEAVLEELKDQADEIQALREAIL